MKHLFARAATLAAAVPLALGVAGTAAHAGPLPTATVPGCYGAGPDWAIVCDLTVSGQTHDPDFSVVWVKVCVGTCDYVPVTWVWVTGSTQVCYSYKDGAGNPASGCTSNAIGSIPAIIKPLIFESLDCDSSGLVCVSEDAA